MRIGFLTSVPITFEAFFLDWISAWTDQGWTVHAASGGPEPEGLEATTYTNIDGLTQDPGLSSLQALKSLAEWRRAHPCDVVITNTATVSALYRVLPRDESTTVYFCHGLHFGDHPDNAVDRAFWAAERLLVSRTDAAIVMNSADVTFFEQHLPADRVHLLAAGVGLDTEHWAEQVRPVQEPADAGWDLVWMGMFTPRKRPEDAVRALEAIRHYHDPGAELTMLGHGPLHEKTIALAAHLGLSDAIAFPGQVDPRKYLADADALIHTAEWEGYCRTLMEASYIGLPAVAYDVKGCRDVFGVEAIGRPGDVQTLCKRLRAVLEDPPVRTGRPDFSWQAAYESVTEFLVGP